MSNLIWIDLEMTGLDPNVNHIIEIATVVTNANLEIIAVGPELAIKQTEEILSSMDDWNQNQHSGSGLLERVRSSNYDLSQAELLTLDFLKQHVEPGVSPMCGNTVSQDRRFLRVYMPELEQFFHYRHLDVSSIKILANLWKPEIQSGVAKQSSHRAKDDILQSIEELNFYKQEFFRV